MALFGVVDAATPPLLRPLPPPPTPPAPTPPTTIAGGAVAISMLIAWKNDGEQEEDKEEEGEEEGQREGDEEEKSNVLHSGWGTTHGKHTVLH